MLQLSICIPLFAVAGIVAACRYPNLRESVSLVAGFSVLYLVFNLYKTYQNGDVARVLWHEILPGLGISFETNPLGLLFALTASFLWVITTIYAIGYMRAHNEQHQTRFYAYFSVAMASVMGIAFADNLFTLFIFYEILTLGTYPLVTHAGSDKAKRSGRIYLGILIGTSILFFLLAIIGTWLITGTLDFTEGGIFSEDVSPVVTGTLLVLFILGIGKAAIMPFHAWLPAAMVAPTPVSALLHAVAVVKAGVFTVLKICLLIFGFDLLQLLPTTQGLLYLAGASVLVASLMALRQDNLKARLAYSTIGQLSYITIGALLATGSAIVGGSMHIAMHAFGKITLFFCAGMIMVSAHKTEISEMRGLGRQMPVTMIAFFIGSLCIIGIPPTGGTWSKWYLISGTFQAEQWILTGVLLVSSLLSIAYLLPIPIRAFFPVGNKQKIRINFREAPMPSLLALTITATGCVLLFFYPQPLYELAAALIP